MRQGLILYWHSSWQRWRGLAEAVELRWQELVQEHLAEQLHVTVQQLWKRNGSSHGSCQEFSMDGGFAAVVVYQPAPGFFELVEEELQQAQQQAQPQRKRRRVVLSEDEA